MFPVALLEISGYQNGNDDTLCGQEVCERAQVVPFENVACISVILGECGSVGKTSGSDLSNNIDIVTLISPFKLMYIGIITGEMRRTNWLQVCVWQVPDRLGDTRTW